MGPLAVLALGLLLPGAAAAAAADSRGTSCMRDSMNRTNPLARTQSNRIDPSTHPTTTTTTTAPPQQQHPEAPAHHPFLRHQPDPLRGAGQALPSDQQHHHQQHYHYFKLADAWAAKEEREVVVPPAQEEATVATPPACPRNARFSFCAVEPVGLLWGDWDFWFGVGVCGV